MSLLIIISPRLTSLFACISRVANNIIAQDNFLFSNNLTQAVRDERQHAARTSSRRQKKFDDTLAKKKAAAVETIKTLKNEFEKERSKRITEMEKVADKLAKERTTWQTFREELVAKVDSASVKVVSEKHRSRTLVQQEFDRSTKQESKLRDQIIELERLNFDLAEVTKTANKEKQFYRRRFLLKKKLAAKRLQRSRSLKDENKELTDKLIELEKRQAAQDAVLERYTQLLQGHLSKEKQMKKYRKSGQKGGASVWEDWVVLMVIELLVLGVPVKAIPGSIMTVYSTLYGKAPDEVPSTVFIYRCRSVVQVVGETLAAWRLAESENWHQIFSDATSRRQCAFQALIVGLMTEDGVLDPVIVSSCIFLEDESARTTFDSIIEKVSTVKVFPFVQL